MQFLQQICRFLETANFRTELESYIESKNPKTASGVEFWQNHWMREQQHQHL